MNKKGLLSALFLSYTLLSSCQSQSQQPEESKQLASPTDCELIPCEDYDYTLGLEPASVEASATWALVEGKPYEEVIKKGADLWVLLHQKKFNVLDAYFEQIQSMYEKGDIDEFVYKEAMYRSSWSGKWYLPLLGDWIEATGSAFAYQLKGHTLRRIAWKKRGSAWASDTSPKDLIAFEAYLSQAQVELARALAINPKLLTCYTGLFTVVQGNSDYDDAFLGWLEDFEKHVPQAYYPRVQILHMLQPRWGGSYEQMRAFSLEAQRYLHLNPRLRALLGFEWADRAVRLRKDGRTQEAIDAYSKAIYHGPMGDWLTARAKLYWKLSVWAKMKSDAEMVISIFPENYYKAHFYKGIALWGLGKHKEADLAFSKAVGIEPNKGPPWYWWGRYLLSQHRFSEAKEKLEKAHTLYPSFPNYLYWYAWALMNADDVKTVKAFEDYLQVCSAKESECEAKDLEWAIRWLECIYLSGNCDLDSHFYHAILPKYNATKPSNNSI